MFNKNIDSPTKIISCYFCERDLQSLTYIYCEECKGLEICVDCFCKGKEYKKHFKNHSFRLINNLKFRIFDKIWSAKEELLFLKGLEIFGFGNWQDISNYVKLKDPREVERHWLLYYQD